MARWQRNARVIVGVGGAAFLVVLVLAFARRAPVAEAPLVTRADSKALVEGTGGKSFRMHLSKEDVSVSYNRILTYADHTKMEGVSFDTDERNGSRSFTVTANEATIGQNESTIVLDGKVVLTSTDGITARTEHATYTANDGAVQAAGPVDFTRGRITGTGVGLKYDKGRDSLTILDQAVVHAAADEKGAGAADVTAGSAAFARRDKYIEFQRDVRIQRGGQVTSAPTAVARMSEDEKRIATIELHGGAHVSGAGGGAGSLQSLAGADMNLNYAPDGQALQRAIVTGEATMQLAGDAGKPGRQVAARLLDIQMAPDGTTPLVLTCRDAVQLTFPPEPGTPGRTIRANSMDGKGEPGRGLTRAVFSGGVQYRERGGDIDRAATSTTLDLALKPGMATIDEARFAHAVKFEEAKMAAQAAAARYDVNKGTLELTGSEPGFATPRIVNEQIAVDATKIDVTLEGPIVNAAGTVKSTLKPQKRDPKAPRAADEKHLPSMLNQDEAVTVLADALSYDGVKATATYTTGARLFQGDSTTIKGDTISIDQTKGDLTASGNAMTTTMRDQVDKDQKKTRALSTGKAKDLRYDDNVRRMTYIGEAHMVGPEGDMTADKIELYLKPEGNDVERAEAYTDAGSKMTLREQNRTTTGARMTYTAAKETYVVTGRPATVVDECARETIGMTLTFVRSTDTILVDGNQQIRTHTKGGTGKCP